MALQILESGCPTADLRSSGVLILFVGGARSQPSVSARGNCIMALDPLSPGHPAIVLARVGR